MKLPLRQNSTSTSEPSDRLSPMKTFVIRALCLVLSLVAVASAQEVIPLYPGTPPGSTQENYP